jgi:hypothetical protein
MKLFLNFFPFIMPTILLLAILRLLFTPSFVIVSPFYSFLATSIILALGTTLLFLPFPVFGFPFRIFAVGRFFLTMLFWSSTSENGFFRFFYGITGETLCCDGEAGTFATWFLIPTSILVPFVFFSGKAS